MEESGFPHPTSLYSGLIGRVFTAALSLPHSLSNPVSHKLLELFTPWRPTASLLTFS